MMQWIEHCMGMMRLVDENNNIFDTAEIYIGNVNKDECPQCHEHIGEGEIYCTNCGLKQDGKTLYIYTNVKWKNGSIQ